MMTAEEFTDALERLGYSQTAFARLIGKDNQTVHCWTVGYKLMKGEKRPRPVPTEIALLIDAMIEGYRPPEPPELEE